MCTFVSCETMAGVTRREGPAEETKRKIQKIETLKKIHTHCADI